VNPTKGRKMKRIVNESRALVKKTCNCKKKGAGQGLVPSGKESQGSGEGRGKRLFDVNAGRRVNETFLRIIGTKVE